MLLSVTTLSVLTFNAATIAAAPAAGWASVINTAAAATGQEIADVPDRYNNSQTENNPALSRILPREVPCTATHPCKGSITHWDGGLGACGQDVNTYAENAVALPVAMMGPLSNSNPLCGRSVTVRHGATGRSATGTVRDKCMGCVGGDLDLTDRLFEAVTDGQGDGRVAGCSWWFGE